MAKTREYKPNYILMMLAAVGGAIFAIGVVLHILDSRIWMTLFGTTLPILEFLFIIVISASAQLVYFDAKKIDAGKSYPHQRTFRAMTWTPGSWGVLVFLLWIVLFPKYLSMRETIFWQNISVEYKTLKAIEREIKDPQEIQVSNGEAKYSKNVRFCPRCNTPYPITMLKHSKHCIICGESLEETC